jgi:type I restriction enzyme S subunit
MIKLNKHIWETVNLESLFLIERGGSPRPIDDYFTDEEDGINWIKIGDTTDITKYVYHTKQKIKPAGIKNSRMVYDGDFILSNSMSFGRPYIMKTTGCIHDGWLLLREKRDNIDKEYLYTVLSSDLLFRQFKSFAAGTTVKNLNIEVVKKVEIPLPPLEEQKQIASLFQSIETAMEQVDGQEKNLHQLKHKLLRDLFSEKQEFGNHLKAKDFETVKFEKIAFNISERVEPKKTELATYVGLEHLDADNLKIERTGTPDDVIGTKLKIYKGDIIFGKRRAYLRKVAVSHFDGIASAHSMILRANEKNIEKDFLPYFMQSDTFMSRAVQISEGSLSPTIKNKTLAVQEFILPKKEKQKELISVFKQFDTTMEQLKQQRTTLMHLKQKLLNEILG